MPGGEFDWIAQLLRPLTRGAPEALDLLDDAAVIPSRPGFDLVVTKDALVAGVHFLTDDPLDLVARKLLRVNLSDLAAKGAEPFGYLLACHWSPRCGWPERVAFVEGLASDQKTFGIHLLGGDTVRTPGPASFSVTLLGWVAKAGPSCGRVQDRVTPSMSPAVSVTAGWGCRRPRTGFRWIRQGLRPWPNAIAGPHRVWPLDRPCRVWSGPGLISPTG